MANENLGIDLLLDSSGDLTVGTTGDLVLTPTGPVCLLQDVRNLLDTLPGDLFGHPEFGAGLPRLAGEEDRPDFEQLVARAITDALTYDDSVGPRIETDSIKVEVVGTGLRDAEFRVTFVPLEDGWSTPENLIWRYTPNGGTP